LSVKELRVVVGAAFRLPLLQVFKLKDDGGEERNPWGRIVRVVCSHLKDAKHLKTLEIDFGERHNVSEVITPELRDLLCESLKKNISLLHISIKGKDGEQSLPFAFYPLRNRVNSLVTPPSALLPRVMMQYGPVSLSTTQIRLNATFLTLTKHCANSRGKRKASEM
jgi:hypothetical protein